MLTLKNLLICFFKDRHAYSIVSEFPIFAPVLIQVTTVHELSLKLLQFAAYLSLMLGSAPCFCALLLGELPVLGSSLCEAREPVLGPRPSGLRLRGACSALPAAWQASAGLAFMRSDLAPLTLPVWPI